VHSRQNLLCEAGCSVDVTTGAAAQAPVAAGAAGVAVAAVAGGQFGNGCSQLFRSDSWEMFVKFICNARPCHNTEVYLSFFLGRRSVVCPHFFLRQLVARRWFRA